MNVKNTLDVNAMLEGNTLRALKARSVNDIKNLKKEWSTEKCISRLSEIKQMYCLSSRRFIMRYLFQWFAADTSDEKEVENCYLTRNNKSIPFIFINPDHKETDINQMSDDEIEKYVDFLCVIASDHNPNADNNASWTWKNLMSKAMHKYPSEKDNYLTREEIFLVANGLHFSVSNIEEYLFRVQGEQGFAVKKSADYIQKFVSGCDKVTNRILTAEEMTRLYKERVNDVTENLKKVLKSDKQKEHHTIKVSADATDLIDKINKSADDLEESIEKYVEWLVSESDSLDRRSETAYRIYRNLFDCIVDKLTDEAENQTSDVLKEFSKTSDQETVQICIEKMNRDLLRCLDDNQEKKTRVQLEVDIEKFSSEFDGTDVYISLKDDTKEYQSQIIRARVRKLLIGNKKERIIAREDLLVLLWCYFNLIWEREALSGRPDKLLYLRYQSFLRIANRFLKEAFFSEIYPVHPMDFCMLSALFSIPFKYRDEKAVIKSDEKPPLDTYAEFISKLGIGKRGSYQKKGKTAATVDTSSSNLYITKILLEDWQKNILTHLEENRENIYLFYNKRKNDNNSMPEELKLKIKLNRSQIVCEMGRETHIIPLGIDYYGGMFVCPASKSTDEGKQYIERQNERGEILVPFCSFLMRYFREVHKISCNVSAQYGQRIKDAPCVIKINKWTKARSKRTETED